jgi:hypothetical protein
VQLAPHSADIKVLGALCRAFWDYFTDSSLLGCKLKSGDASLNFEPRSTENQPTHLKWKGRLRRGEYFPRAASYTGGCEFKLLAFLDDNSCRNALLAVVSSNSLPDLVE